MPCGTTGESPTLSHDEHIAIVRKCVSVVKRRIPVIAGAGSNSTAEALALTRAAQEVGADAVLSVVPYYNKPTQAGMIAHFTAIADVGLPVIVYNIPGRCVVDMTDETLAALARHPQIAGVKDATGDLSRPAALAALVGDDICQLSGNDDSIGEFMARGGDGIISVVGNIAPQMNARMIKAHHSGDMEIFNALRDKLAPLARALFCESSPAPVKYAAQLLGLCRDEVRLPLVPASAAARSQVEAALAQAGLAASAEAPSA